MYLNGSFVTLSAAQHSDKSAVGQAITTTTPTNAPDPPAASTATTAISDTPVISTMGATRWRRISSPGATGSSPRRIGWSTSCPMGSTASQAATISANAATSTKGVVPRQTQYSDTPATTPSTHTRMTRTNGQRKKLRQSRRQTARLGPSDREQAAATDGVAASRMRVAGGAG